MSFDTFKAEQKAIGRAQAALDNLDTVDIEAEFRELLIAYVKLLKVTGRIVRMSDRSEERLKVANVTIVRQQQELEKAHGNSLSMPSCLKTRCATEPRSWWLLRAS